MKDIYPGRLYRFLPIIDHFTLKIHASSGDISDPACMQPLASSVVLHL
ncbi:hypothetical protein ABID22_003138 [Pontibacter aydingkolensis]